MVSCAAPPHPSPQLGGAGGAGGDCRWHTPYSGHKCCAPAASAGSQLSRLAAGLGSPRSSAGSQTEKLLWFWPAMAARIKDIKESARAVANNVKAQLLLTPPFGGGGGSVSGSSSSSSISNGRGGGAAAVEVESPAATALPPCIALSLECLGVHCHCHSSLLLP